MRNADETGLDGILLDNARDEMAELIREIDTGTEDRDDNVIPPVLGTEEEKLVVDLGAVEGRVAMLLTGTEEDATNE